jgi:hypothetical protein
VGGRDLESGDVQRGHAFHSVLLGGPVSARPVEWTIDESWSTLKLS